MEDDLEVSPRLDLLMRGGKNLIGAKGLSRDTTNPMKPPDESGIASSDADDFVQEISKDEESIGENVRAGADGEIGEANWWINDVR